MKLSPLPAQQLPIPLATLPLENRFRLARTPFAAWLAVIGSALALQGRAFSADQTWIQANANNDWSLTAPNWDAGVSWTNGNNAIFGDTGETVELSGNLSVGDITFNSTGYVIGDADGDGQLTFGGSPSTITVTTLGQTATISDSIAGGGITKAGAGTLVLSGANTYTGITTVNGSSVLTVANNNALGSTSSGTTVNSGSRVVLNNGITVTGETINLIGNGDNFGALQAAAGATATWAGTVILADGTGNAQRLGTAAGGTLIVSGAIVNGGGNTLGISATGTGVNQGVVVLSGTSSYSGATNIVRGILKLGTNNALPVGTTLDVDNTTAAEDSTFDLNGFNQTVALLQRSGTGTGGGTGGSFVTNSSATASTLTVNPGSTAAPVFSGVIKDGAGTVSLVKTGAGSLTLSGSNTGTGSLTVNAGTLAVNGATGKVSFAAINLNGGTFTVDNTGAGNNSADHVANTSDFTFGGGTLLFKGSDQTSTPSTETLHNLTLGTGNSTITLTASGTNAVTVTANQLTHASGGGAALVNGVGLGTASSRLLLTVAPTLVGSTDALSTGINTNVVNTKIVPFLVGEATATTGGTGTVTGVPNTFLTYDPTTGLRPLNPTDEFSATIAAGANVRLAVGGNAVATQTINSLILAAPANANAIAITGTLTNTSGAVLFVTANSITGGTFDFGTAEAMVTADSGATGQISSKITGSGGLTLSGLGTLGLGSTTSTYTGNTTLLSGVLVPQTSSVVTGGNLVSGPLGLSTLVLAGGSIRSASTGNIEVANPVLFKADTTVPGGGGGTFTLSGAVTLSGGTRTLTQNATQSTIFSGAIGDGGQGLGLTIAGSGTAPVVFSGTNTYGGITTINSGRTLQIGNGSTTGTLGTGAVVATGTLAFNRSNAFTVSNAISGTGSVTQIGTGTTTLSGANTYTGPTTIKSGGLIISGSVTAGITVGDSAALATTATLGGSGSVGSVTATGSGDATTTGATINPGNAGATAGILTSTGAFSLTNGAHLKLDIGGSTAGGETTTGYDQIISGGAVTLTGGDLTLSLLGSPTFATGSLLYLIINNSTSSVTGTFGTLANASFDPQNIVLNGQTFRLIYNANYAGPGSDGVANDVALLAVPEPTTWAMTLGGLGMLLLFRRPPLRRRTR